MELEDLLDTLTSIEGLLSKSGHADKAQWLAGKRTLIIIGTMDETRKVLQDIRSHIYGMGSLADLYLRPIPETGLSSMEARNILLGLLEQLFDEIGSALTSN